MVEMLVSYCTTKWRWSRQQGVLAVLSSSWRRAQIERTALYPRVCKMVDVVFDSCAGCEMAPAVECRDLSWARHCQRHPLTRRPATFLDRRHTCGQQDHLSRGWTSVSVGCPPHQIPTRLVHTDCAPVVLRVEPPIPSGIMCGA
jgi:hypothetical protein